VAQSFSIRRISLRFNRFRLLSGRFFVVNKPGAYQPVDDDTITRPLIAV
jgi:hypothetical protein